MRKPIIEIESISKYNDSVFLFDLESQLGNGCYRIVDRVSFVPKRLIDAYNNYLELYDNCHIDFIQDALVYGGGVNKY